MRMQRRSSGSRKGMTLLEVMVALAIFLFSLVAISQLTNMATAQAVEIQFRSRATRLAESKLNEYVAGVRSLQSGGSGNFDLEPDWQWNADVQQQSMAQGLYYVTITVSHNNSGKYDTTLSQYILDPTTKGAIQPSTSSSDMSGSTTTPSTTGSTGSTPNQTPQSSGANSVKPPTTTSPPATGGSMPATGGGSSGTKSSSSGTMSSSKGDS